MTTLIRTTSFWGFSELVSQLGGQPEIFLQRYHIDPRLLGDEDARVPLRSFIEVLENAASVLSCPDFGLRMAHYQDVHVLGPIALIARSAATVGQALEEIVRFIGYHSPGIRLELDSSEPETSRLRIDIRLPGAIQPRQLQELALGVAHNTMKLLCGSSFRAQAVLLRGISPLPITRYRRYFNAGILKGQDCNALVFHRSQLEQAIELRDPLLYRTLVQYLSAYAARPKDLRSQVEFLILRMLPTQRCRLPLVAEQLGLHERVLQRRLAEQGCGFDDLLEGLRKERADCYLAERDMSMSQVAGLLGYSEQSVFNRACRRWFGMAPRARRRKLLERE
ncbi:TPA: AraC family transcriptional regulator [Pseudomonas aeruginosa]|nr:AraC family transcriptional regulator [Pseudomonas aeruginosa]HEJ2119928.1 AraC family transcriptional regulator [Pseudomonas aeruginosa]HEJ2749777.1 AraC family transcriptional regulator [Pseudomonas aeruginosa]HEJ2896551.1 AraC family transcriptional regulator [Pseudomonas aeruginosa]HEJ4639158.1 AraC family transcriptional regulator [Pseudomonas aeruginosa]